MKQPAASQTRPGHRVELALLVLTLLVATFVRFHRPDAVPPGPSHDELRMMDLGELIVEGERPIHWTISYSAEPLFMYLLALAMPVWGFTPFGARLVTRFTGILLIPLVHRLTRRLFGRRVALVTSGVLAVTWWPLFFSRVALRGITLPLTFTAAVYCLWRGLQLQRPTGRTRTVRWGWLVLGGGLMGLTWYTFTAARGLVILLPVLLGYLGTMRLVGIRRLWRIALLTIVTAALIAAPFVYEMQVHPGAPEARLDQLNTIIMELKSGNLLPFVRQTLNALGVLILTGDLNWRYNISGRPAFGPALGALAVLGFITSIARWRRPGRFLVVVWLMLGLAPSMLTPEAPSFVRAIGALPAAAMLPGIGAIEIWDWIAARAGKGAPKLIPVLLTVLLTLNGLAAFHGLFITWPKQPQVREIYQASLREALHDLNHSDLLGPIWISEPFPDDRHLLLAKRVLQREAIEPRWFDAGRALILPPVDGVRRYLLADFVRPDPELFRQWMSRGTIKLEGEAPVVADEPAYRVYELEGGSWVREELLDIIRQSTAYTDLEAQHAVSLPARFEEAATLLGYRLTSERLAPGSEVHLIVYWRTDGSVHEPLSSFVHLLNGQSNVMGQYDGFDVPPWHWQPGAVIAQVYRFPLDKGTQSGSYWLEAGLYNPQTMGRLQVVDDAGSPISDRLVLCKVIVH